MGIIDMKNKAPSDEEDWILGQIKQQPSRIQAAPIGRPVRQLLNRYGLTQTQAAQDLSEAWKQAAGPELASVTRPGNINRGVLLIFTQNSSALQELHLRRRQILAALGRSLPHVAIKDLRGRVESIE